jgi:predicted dienelactone hydrolase
VAALLAQHATAGAAPDPTAPGPHAVGYRLTTVTRRALDGTERRLDTTIWYPALARGESVDAQGYLEAAARPGRHPVLIYSHGGCAYPEASSFLTRGLAAWGFIVIAPSHPGDTVFDGFDVCDAVELRAPTLVERVADVHAALDAFLRDSRSRSSPFFRRVTRSRVGILGWSSGASTAIVAGRDDRRIDAVLSLAPDARPERIGTAALRVPVMVMVGELDYYDPAQTSLSQVYGFLRAPRYAVQLLRTGHFAFSDICINLPGGQDCRPGSLSQQEAHRVVLRFAVPFLQRHVAGAGGWGPLLQASETADATLHAERRRRAR